MCAILSSDLSCSGTSLQSPTCDQLAPGSACSCCSSFQMAARSAAVMPSAPPCIVAPDQDPQCSLPGKEGTARQRVVLVQDRLSIVPMTQGCGGHKLQPAQRHLLGKRFRIAHIAACKLLPATKQRYWLGDLVSHCGESLQFPLPINNEFGLRGSCGAWA